MSYSRLPSARARLYGINLWIWTFRSINYGMVYLYSCAGRCIGNPSRGGPPRLRHGTKKGTPPYRQGLAPGALGGFEAGQVLRHRAGFEERPALAAEGPDVWITLRTWASLALSKARVCGANDAGECEAVTGQARAPPRLLPRQDRPPRSRRSTSPAAGRSLGTSCPTIESIPNSQVTPSTPIPPVCRREAECRRNDNGDEIHLCTLGNGRRKCARFV